MNGYTIEYIYFVFPILCLLSNFIKTTNKSRMLFLFVVFTIIYTLSLNGSDFHGYRYGYEVLENHGSRELFHGEYGYFLIASLFVKLEFDYVGFRIVFLGVSSLVLFYSVYQISPKPAISLCLISCMFVVYLISTYRQYMVMAFTVYCCLEYCRGHKWRAIIIMALMTLIHQCALEPLIFLLMYHFGRRKIIEKINRDISKLGFGLLIFAFITRAVFTVMLRINLISNFLTSIFQSHAGVNPTPFSFGMMSRSFFLFLVVYLYYKVKPSDKLLNLIYWLYVTGMVAYIMVPLEFFMGRLMNNVNILVTLLIPMLLCYEKRYESDDPLISSSYNAHFLRGKILFKVSLMTALVMLVFQLINQDGYTPYYNVLKGDRVDNVVFQVK